jgi:hypothetical protein
MHGQAAIEVLAYAGFFFLVFVAAVSVFLNIQNQEMTRAENSYAQEIAYGFSDSIHTAFVAGPGFVQTVKVPPNLLGRRYWLKVSFSPTAATSETGLAYVEWQSFGRNASYSAQTITANYEAMVDSLGFVTIQPGNFIVIDASQNLMINISNQNGKIRIQKG